MFELLPEIEASSALQGSLLVVESDPELRTIICE